MELKSVLDVLADKVLVGDDCWEWTGWHNAKGYPCANVRDVTKPGKQRKEFVHRLTYEMVIGPIPDGAQLDHLCRNRGCVRPDHLEPVTPRENLMRGETHAARLAARTHCSYGHEFTPENTIQREDGRRCRECNKAQCRDYGRRNPRKR